jgi:hypothetical protein
MGGPWETERQTARELVGAWIDGRGGYAAAARELELGPNGRQRLHDFRHRGGTIAGDAGMRLADAVGIPFRTLSYPDRPISEFFEGPARRGAA